MNDLFPAWAAWAVVVIVVLVVAFVAVSEWRDRRRHKDEQNGNA